MDRRVSGAASRAVQFSVQKLALLSGFVSMDRRMRGAASRAVQFSVQ